MANEEHLTILKQGVAAWNTWRTEKWGLSDYISEAELSEIRPHSFLTDPKRFSFRRAIFGGADLLRVDLRGADLKGANLTQANLRLANLSGADLRGADLSGANLTQANLFGADLSEADLSGAYLSATDVREARLEKANFKRTHLYRADLRNTHLEDVDFREADLSHANLKDADLKKANLRNANLSGVDLIGANLKDADLRGAKLSYKNLMYAKHSGAKVDGAIPIEEPHESDEPLGDKRKINASSETTIRFMVCYRNQVKPEKWYDMLSYFFDSDAIRNVEKDLDRVLGKEVQAYSKSVGRSNQMIKSGAEILVVPEMDGVIFNPPKASVNWSEAWHRVNFRAMASPEVPGFQKNGVMDGKVSFYVGPILLSEIETWCTVSEEVSEEINRFTADVYDAIFVSYSHKDYAIIEELEKAYKVLGMDYLRDVQTLRSGEGWFPRLLSLIDQADIFQLCWSENAKSSFYVEQEWRHALKKNKPMFIRPMYWEEPMPSPPEELADLHFSHYEIDTAG